MNKIVLAIILAVSIYQPKISLAKDIDGIVELRNSPNELNPEKGYILFRSSRAKTGLFGIENAFLRIPTNEETAAWRTSREKAYQKALPSLTKKAKDGTIPSIDEFPFEYDGPENLFSSHTDRFLIDGKDIRTFLMEVPKGDYVLYGISFAGRTLITCNCLGTVSFPVRAGVITDLGTLYADKVHNQSPLSPLESNIGPSMARYGFIMGQALVPPTPTDAKPEILKHLSVENANLKAVGPFQDPLAMSINRLAPIADVLAYDHGKVIDVKSGNTAP